MSKSEFRRNVCLVAFFFTVSISPSAAPAATLDDLKKLEIICFVPSHLPAGFRLKEVGITYDELHEEFDDMTRQLPLYSITYEGNQGATFSIESAREGVGDRNVMVEEDTEDGEIQTALGPMYLIYRPKGKSGRKAEIITNWVRDANMNAEQAKNAEGHPVLGRFHGFTGTNMTVAEFTKIAQSLHPIRSARSAAPASTLKIHPKVFSMIGCWLSDSESPVVTEINLDAVEKNGNQFNSDDVKPDGEWTRCPGPEGNGGFMRYRVLESKGNRFKVEYQENGGGTLTTAAIIGFEIEKRNIRYDGKPATMRVLRVLSYDQK